MTFVFLWCTLLRMIISKSIHVAADGFILFFFTAEWYCILYVCRAFFISYPAGGHSVCFHVVAVVSSAAVSAGVHVSFQIMVFSRYVPRSGIARSCGGCIFGFLRKSMLFSIVVIPIYIPTNSVGEFPFLHTFPSWYTLFNCAKKG